MDNLAKKSIFPEVTQQYAVVTEKGDQMFQVKTGQGTLSARKAVSCLVVPEINDRVLVARSGGGRSGYILAVLERQDETAAAVVFANDTVIRVEGGRLGLAADKGVDLMSEKEVNFVSSEIGITAGKGHVRVDRLDFWGSAFSGQIDRVKLLARRFDAFVDHLFQKCIRSFRHTDQMDQLKTGRLHYEAEQSLQLRGGFSQMTAKEDVHIDGERINIG